jgi:2-isopropylmalate synthase
VLRERTTYEIMDPTEVGMVGSVIVMGKHSGRAALRHTLDELEIDLDGPDFEQAFARMKAIADREGEVPQETIRAIAQEVVAGNDLLDDLAASFA